LASKTREQASTAQARIWLLVARCDSLPTPRQWLRPLYPGGFHALTKIRQSLREKKPPLGRRAEDELDAVRGDLQASQDDASASKEVIHVLRKEVRE
jgi:hypothetical protein